MISFTNISFQFAVIMFGADTNYMTKDLFSSS